MSQPQNSAEENYNNGIKFFQHQNYTQGVKCFAKSAKEDFKPAIKELGLCYLHGIGLNQDLDRAIIYFKNSKNNPESQFELAKLFFFGYGVKKDLDIATKLLILAVQNKYPPALNLMAVCYTLSNNTKHADLLFNLSLSKGNIFSKHLFSLDLFKKSEEQSNLDFIKDYKWPEFIKSTKPQHLNKSPEIFSINNLISNIECEYIKYIASPFMRESMTVDPNNGELVKDSIRTSYSGTLDWMSEDPAINFIIQKCCLNFNVASNQSEVMHVLHYSIGEEYKPHYDFFGGLHGEDNFKPEQQRIKTIIMYLNDVIEGGTTSFPKLGLKVKPKKGTVVFFENFDMDSNQPYLESLHAGDPILQGEKWLATLWIKNTNAKRGPNYESI